MLISVISLFLFFFSPKGAWTESFGNHKKKKKRGGGTLYTFCRRREKTTWSKWTPLFGVMDRSQTLVRGPGAKKGRLKFKIFDPCKGGPEKNRTNFPVKIEFTCVSLGLTHNFHGKKGPEIFLRSERGPKKFRDFFFFASGPPYKCLWTVP